jgi:hypothetical protein
VEARAQPAQPEGRTAGFGCRLLPFVIIRAVRAILIALLVAGVCSGDTLDEAVRSLARRMSGRLTATDIPRVTVRNLSTMSAAEAAAARASLERAIAKPAVRSDDSIDITLTISENLRGFLLVAELRRNGERVVEMVEFSPASVEQATLRAVLEKRLLWEQNEPILDIAVAGDTMIVLEPARISTVDERRRNAERWLDGVNVVRDPRGRLEIRDGSFTAYLPGSLCRGTWKPVLEVRCESIAAEFLLNGEPVRFTPGRNTLESGGWPPFFSLAKIEDQRQSLVALSQPDGRTQLYSGDRRPVGVIESVGTEIVSLENSCAAGRTIVASSTAEEGDSLGVYEFADGKLAPAGEPLEFAGPITALWPSAGGAVAVSSNMAAGTYAAYSVAIDCGR